MLRPSACGYFNFGIRVFDIRDPLKPKEIAHYNPAGTTTLSPGSNHKRTGGWVAGSPDWCTAQIRLDAHAGTLMTTLQCPLPGGRGRAREWPPAVGKRLVEARLGVAAARNVLALIPGTDHGSAVIGTSVRRAGGLGRLALKRRRSRVAAARSAGNLSERLSGKRRLPECRNAGMPGRCSLMQVPMRRAASGVMLSSLQPHRELAVPRKTHTFAPQEDQVALWPEVFGNAINGVGEPELRQPRPVYWYEPYPPDRKDTFGADTFCTHRRVCTHECPPGAITQEKQIVRGEFKWCIDFDRCLPYVNETMGFGICIAVSAGSRPGATPNLLGKLRMCSERALDVSMPTLP